MKIVAHIVTAAPGFKSRYKGLKKMGPGGWAAKEKKRLSKKKKDKSKACNKMKTKSKKKTVSMTDEEKIKHIEDEINLKKRLGPTHTQTEGFKQLERRLAELRRGKKSSDHFNQFGRHS